MRQLTAALLVLLTQVFAICAPGSVVVCSGTGGSAAIELAGSSCCRAAHEAEAAARLPAADERAPAVRSGGETCRDATVRPDQTTLARSSSRSEPAQATPDIPATIVAWLAPPCIVAASTARLPLLRPPPDAVPRPVRALVLRC